MNFCINCGVKLDKSDDFCIECGAKIKNTPLSENKVFEEENTRGFKKSEFRFKAEKKSKKTFKFIISLFILIIFFMLNQKNIFENHFFIFQLASHYCTHC